MSTKNKRPARKSKVGKQRVPSDRRKVKAESVQDPKSARLEQELLRAEIASANRAKAKIGSNIIGGMLESMDPNTSLQGPLWRGTATEHGIVQEMVRDVHVAAALNTAKIAIYSADWRAQAVRNPEPIDRAIADLTQWAFIDRLHVDRMLEAVMNFTRDGFSLLEWTWTVVETPLRFRGPGVPDRIVVPAAVYDVPSWTVDRWFAQKANGRALESIGQDVAGDDTEKGGISEMRVKNSILRFTQNQEGSNFEGLADLRPTYGPWFLKNGLTKFEAIRHERFAVPTPVATAPVEGGSDDDEDYVVSAIKNLRSHEKNYAVMPGGWELDLVELQGSSSIGETIERMNRDIALSFGAGVSMLGQMKQGTGSGSFALADVLQGLLHQRSVHNARTIGQTMRHGSDGWGPLEVFTRVNFGEQYEPAHFIAKRLPTKNYVAVLEALNRCTDAGTIRKTSDLEAEALEILELPAYRPEAAEGFVKEDAEGDQVQGADAPSVNPEDPRDGRPIV